MKHTRVIYTDSTTAECHTALKNLNFEEDSDQGAFTHLEDDSIMIYLLWGRNEHYPDLHVRLGFNPRVQVHLISGEKVDELDNATREVAVALRNLDPNSRIQIFDTDSKLEIT